jgi:hypothetical protein
VLVPDQDHRDSAPSTWQCFTAIAGRKRIKKMAGPTCLPAEHALQIIHRISKKGTVRSLPLTAKSSEWAFRPEEYACRSR